jgi:hypothetical protein
MKMPNIGQDSDFARQPDFWRGILNELATYQIEDNLPADLAEQHDHYLYGTPKKY